MTLYVSRKAIFFLFFRLFSSAFAQKLSTSRPRRHTFPPLSSLVHSLGISLGSLTGLISLWSACLVVSFNFVGKMRDERGFLGAVVSGLGCCRVGDEKRRGMGYERGMEGWRFAVVYRRLWGI